MVGRGENRFFGLRSNASPEPDQLDSDVLNVKGLNLAKRGKLLEAILCFQKAVHLNPNNSKLWYNYGTSLTKIGKFDDSTLHCFEKAIQIDPNDAEAWNNRGSVLYALGRNREARICYERSIELAPTNGRAWRNMGVLFEKLGDKKTAKECYKRAAETRLKI
jgi:Flp pilus assembly protein TadD